MLTETYQNPKHLILHLKTTTWMRKPQELKDIKTNTTIELRMHIEPKYIEHAQELDRKIVVNDKHALPLREPFIKGISM